MLSSQCQDWTPDIVKHQKSSTRQFQNLLNSITACFLDIFIMDYLLKVSFVLCSMSLAVFLEFTVSQKILPKYIKQILNFFCKCEPMRKLHTSFWESNLILRNCICQTTVGFHKPAFMTGLIEESNSRVDNILIFHSLLQVNCSR